MLPFGDNFVLIGFFLSRGQIVKPVGLEWTDRRFSHPVRCIVSWVIAVSRYPLQTKSNIMCCQGLRCPQYTVHNVLPGLVGRVCNCLQRCLGVARNGDGLALREAPHLASRYLVRDHLDGLVDSDEFSCM